MYQAQKLKKKLKKPIKKIIKIIKGKHFKLIQMRKVNALVINQDIGIKVKKVQADLNEYGNFNSLVW